MSISFEDLVVWKRSCALAVRLYGLLSGSREYVLKDQMLRAAVSIPSNIAEGSERNSIPDFKRFLSIARGSAAELRTQAYLAKKIGLLDAENGNSIVNELKEVSRMLQGLSTSLGKSRLSLKPKTGNQ